MSGERGAADLGPHRVAMWWCEDQTPSFCVNFLAPQESVSLILGQDGWVPMAEFWQDRRLTLRERLAVRFGGVPDPRRDLVMVEEFESEPAPDWSDR